MLNKIKIQRWGRVSIAGLLVAQILFSYAAQVNSVQAQLNNNAGDANTVNNNGTTKIDVPKYEGVQDSIKAYLCTPPEDASGKADYTTEKLGTSLFDCIGRIYRFGIAFGAIALVFFVVLAGYFYITGGELGKGKGKTIFTTALTGMALILGSYVLLNFINPSLTVIKPIQAPIFNAADLPSCEAVGFQGTCVLPSGQVQTSSGGGGSYGGRSCTPITNDASPASINNLSRSCFAQYGADVVRQASIVASRESGGRPDIPVGKNSCPNNTSSRCAGGEAPVWGLYQINLTVHKVGGLNCPAAFSNGWTCSRGCRVINQALYNQCVAAAINPINNIEAACRIYEQSGRKFTAWGNSGNEHGIKCGF